MGLIVRLYDDSTFFWDFSEQLSTTLLMPVSWYSAMNPVFSYENNLISFSFFYRPKKVTLTWIFHIWFLKLLLLQCNSNEVVKKLSLKDWKAFLSFPQIYIEQSLQACISGKNIWHRQWRKETKNTIFGKAGIKSDERQHWDLINFKPPPQTGSDCPSWSCDTGLQKPSSAWSAHWCAASSNLTAVLLATLKPCQQHYENIAEKKLFLSY